MTVGRLRIGDEVRQLALPADDGTTWRLHDQRGRPTLLILHRHLR